jgi:hypothetical protein
MKRGEERIFRSCHFIASNPGSKVASSCNCHQIKDTASGSGCGFTKNLLLILSGGAVESCGYYAVSWNTKLKHSDKPKETNLKEIT